MMWRASACTDAATPPASSSSLTSMSRDDATKLYPECELDVASVVRQAKENRLRVKYYGGCYPIETTKRRSGGGGGDVYVSLRQMRQVVGYNHDRATLTVEAGLRLGDFLAKLERLNATVELYGVVPDTTVADAINVGLVASNGCIAHCVDSCKVLQADGDLVDWTWREDGVAGRRRRGDVDDDDDDEDFPAVPSLRALVSGLGAVGIVTAATFRCVPLHRSQEVVYESDIDDVVSDPTQFRDTLYSHVHWYPLLGRCVVVKAFRVRLQQSFGQPLYKAWAEWFFGVLYRLAGKTLPFLAWCGVVSPTSSSAILFALMLSAMSRRSYFCFKPHILIPVETHCSGIMWIFPRVHLCNVVQRLRRWCEGRRDAGAPCTPVVISYQSRPLMGDRRPFLCPYASRRGAGAGGGGVGVSTCSLWTDWFEPRLIRDGYSAAMAEVEAILQENGGRKCWSAGPVYASPLIGQMYPGFRKWCYAKVMLDPLGMLRSAYVHGDLVADAD